MAAALLVRHKGKLPYQLSALPEVRKYLAARTWEEAQALPKQKMEEIYKVIALEYPEFQLWTTKEIQAIEIAKLKSEFDLQAREELKELKLYEGNEEGSGLTLPTLWKQHKKGKVLYETFSPELWPKTRKWIAFSTIMQAVADPFFKAYRLEYMETTLESLTKEFPRFVSTCASTLPQLRKEALTEYEEVRKRGTFTESAGRVRELLVSKDYSDPKGFSKPTKM